MTSLSMFKTIDVSDDDFYCITSLINDKKKLVAWNEQGHLQKLKTYNNKISMPCLMSLVFVNITVRSENTNPQWSWKTIWSFHYYHSNLASWWRWKRNSNTCDRVIMPSIFGRNPSTGSIWLPFMGIQQKIDKKDDIDSMVSNVQNLDKVRFTTLSNIQFQNGNIQTLTWLAKYSSGNVFSLSQQPQWWIILSLIPLSPNLTIQSPIQA